MEGDQTRREGSGNLEQAVHQQTPSHASPNTIPVSGTADLSSLQTLAQQASESTDQLNQIPQYNQGDTLLDLVAMSIPIEKRRAHSRNPNHSTLNNVSILQDIDSQFQSEQLPGWPLSQTSYESVPEPGRINAFAKLEFADSTFYMTTHAIELGRDIDAARQVAKREMELDIDSESRSGKQSACGNGYEKARQPNDPSIADSVVSESGGLIADHKRSQRMRSSPRIAPNARAGIQTMPAPDIIPLIKVHPPAGNNKSISRKHIRIAFNFDRQLFEVEIIGRNGAFVDDEWYCPGAVEQLVSASTIQIGGLIIKFILPDVPLGETGAEMSVDEDLLSGEKLSSEMADSNDQASEVEVESGEAEEENEGEEVANIQREKRKTSKVQTRGADGKDDAETVPAKRKGPGRPPKNGVMSKREQAIVARQSREEAKAKAEGKNVVPTDDGKAKSGQATKEEQTSVQPNGKRKYTKRRRAGGTEDQQAVRPSTEHTELVPPDQGLAVTLPKPVKEKKPAKPPRSPSPVFDESKMTPEQLAKPQSSYVVLIHEALSNSKTGQMSLPQIYRAIERRYPFYKLRVQTQGWQSSVRHNLSQHAAFRKIERDGKGWMWGLVPEVSIEKEKKRRPTPPPASQQHYYPPNPIMQHPYQYPGMPAQNGQMPPAPYGMHHGMPIGRLPYPPPPLSRPGLPLPLVNAQSESTYRSPYQSTPPPAASQSTPQPPQPSNVNGTKGINGHHPTASGLQKGQDSNNSRPPAGSPDPPTPQVPTPSGPSAPLSLGQDVNQAVNKFKTALINTMGDKVRGELLVTSAINRVLGIQAKSSLPDEDEDPHEKAIMKTFSSMLGDMSTKNLGTKQQDSHPGPFLANTPAAPENSAQSGELPTSTATAVEEAAKVALTNGRLQSASPTTPHPKRGPEINGGIKRPLKNSDDETSANTLGHMEAKRAAVGQIVANEA